MKTQHTPTPWAVGPHPGNDAGTSWRTVLANGEFGKMYIAEALDVNAELIVRAVNAHADLVAACQRVLDVLQDGSIDYDDQAVIEDMHDTLRNAISKAKGES